MPASARKKRSKLSSFLRNLRLVVQERLSAATDRVVLEWEYHVTRAWIWHGYKTLNEAEFDPEFGGYQVGIDPQEVDNSERYLEVLKTMKLRRIADKLHVRMPDESNPENYGSVNWDYDEREPKYLTRHGLRLLLPELRAAQKERREAAGFWFGIAVGLIGSLTGLIAVLSRN